MSGGKRIQNYTRKDSIKVVAKVMVKQAIRKTIAVVLAILAIIVIGYFTGKDNSKLKTDEIADLATSVDDELIVQ
jgi:hypothetical protein